MDKPYKSIPTQGKHQGDASGLESGLNVRAPEPPDPEELTEEPVRRTHQFLYNEQKGLYRLRLWSTEDVSEPPEGFSEVGRYTAEDLPGAYENLPDEPRYIVFENTETGEVFYHSERELSTNWAETGEFDQVTVFAEEPDAAAYAESRQRKTS